MKNRAVDIITGQNGSGKTTLAAALIAPLTRVLIVDVGFNEFGALEFFDLESLAAYLEERGRSHGFFKVTYTPLEHEIPVLFEMAKILGQHEEITLVLEECDALPDPAICKPYDELISRGRHFDVNLMGITLYPYKVPPRLRRQATSIYSFRQHEPDDLKYLQDVYRRQVDELITIPDYQFLKWTRNGICSGRTFPAGGFELSAAEKRKDLTTPAN